MSLLDENAVIGLLERGFIAAGFEILSKCTTSECGVDLHARKGTVEWMIEAKGETSASERSARFGRTFTGSQIDVHVARAVYQAISLRQRYPEARIGIGLVHEERHHKRIAPVLKVLNKLNIDVIWVERDGRVALPLGL